MFTFAANDQIGYLTSEKICDYIFSIDLLQISLKFVHHAVEKFINIGLNPGVDRLPIIDESLA